MTTVCAVARAGRVVMGADSMAVLNERALHGRTKVIELQVKDPSANPDHPSLLLGFAGNGALSDLVLAHFTVDAAPAPDDDPQPWAATVAQGVTQIAIENWLVDNGKLDGNLLLGWAGHVWTIHTNGAHRHPDGVAAIGSGAEFALGALYMIDTWPRSVGEAESVEDAVKAAVTVASHLDIYSGGPPLVLSIP